MFGLIGASILGNAANSAINGALSLHNQKKLFEFENKNKHQFEVADLRAAGLNPILSAMNPQTASVGGTSLSGSDGGTSSVNSALSYKAKKAEIKVAQMNAETELKKVQVEDKKAQAALITAQAAKDNSASTVALNDSHIALNKVMTSGYELDLKYKPALIASQLQEIASRSVANYASANASNAASAASYSIATRNAEEIKLTKQFIRKAAFDGSISQEKEAMLSKELNWYEDHPWMFNIKMFFKDIGPGVNAAATAATVAK